MHDPDSYDAYSQFQRRDAKELVPYLVSKMNWEKQKNAILDVGCGSGFNTRNVLIPSLADTKKASFVYAVDVSKNMIDFASVKYTHSDIAYMVADITKQNSEFPCKFDKIFSFHVLHWIPDQEKVLRLLGNMLNANGEIGMYYLSSAAVFTVYDSMSRNPKWASYFADARNFIPKSHFSADPAKDMHQLMASIGYFVQESKVLTRSFEFDSVNAMIDAAMAANPFLHKIPGQMQEDYKRDFRDCFTPLIHAAPSPELPDAIQVDYDLVLIRAMKS